MTDQGNCHWKDSLKKSLNEQKHILRYQNFRLPTKEMITICFQVVYSGKLLGSNEDHPNISSQDFNSQSFELRSSYSELSLHIELVNYLNDTCLKLTENKILWRLWIKDAFIRTNLFEIRKKFPRALGHFGLKMLCLVQKDSGLLKDSAGILGFCI